MSILPIAALLLAQAPPAAAVPPPPAPTRQLMVTVTDAKGEAVEGLAPEEVAVTENGVARELTRLELDRRPLTVAVVLDTSEPVGTLYRLHMVDAVVQFLSRLPEGSKFAIWGTGDRPTRVLDYTDDVPAASRALRRVVPQGGNTLLDAIVEVSRDLVRREGERTAVVVVTALGIGFRNYDRQQVVEEGLRSGAQFSAVQIEEGRLPPGAERAGIGEVDSSHYEYVISGLTEKTGGRRETTLSAMGVDSALRKVGAALRGQYRLTYEGLPGVEDPRVEVTVARPAAKVRVAGPRR